MVPDRAVSLNHSQPPNDTIPLVLLSSLEKDGIDGIHLLLPGFRSVPHIDLTQLSHWCYFGLKRLRHLRVPQASFVTSSHRLKTLSPTYSDLGEIKNNRSFLHLALGVSSVIAMRPL